MNIPVYVLLAATLAVSTIPAEGRDRRPLREARSENDRYHLQIDGGRGESRRCHAALFEHPPKERHARRVWREKLVNEVAPGYALIRDDGRFVITLDEFRRGGAAHALVIYNERGKLLREFELRELLHGDDWKHVNVEQRAIEWLSEAEFTFVDSPPQFDIKLEWEREIRIDLETLQIVGKGAEASGPSGEMEVAATTQPRTCEADDAVPPEILALLEAATSGPSTGSDHAAASAQQVVQQALLKLHALAMSAGVEVEGLDSAAALAAASIARDVTSTTASETGQERPTTAGNSATTGVPVPAPDPANPVDYVAWMREQTLTDGPSAVPYYQAAMDSLVKWEGDNDLFSAAINGDPEALALPEITEWLAANQDALDQFRAATDFEFRGMPMETCDGTVIGFLLPHLSNVRLLAKAAVIEARQFEAAGDVDAAMDCYLDVVAAGAQAGQGPTLIENLVGIAMQALASDQVLDSFARLDDDDVDYVGLAEAMVDSYRPTRPIEETFQFERVMILDVIQRSYEWNPETESYRVSEEGLEHFSDTLGMTGGPSPGELALGFVLGNIGFESMTEQLNTHYDALTNAARMPYQQGRRAFQDAEAPIQDPSFRFRNPLLSVLLPSLSRATHLTTKSESNRRATLLVTHLKAYRQQYGTYPDSLNVFGDSEMVIDPFTDESFAYHRDGDDFVLYSLSANGVDDGGVHDRRGDTNDLLYWPRPPKD
jgi:hypothetical protein